MLPLLPLSSFTTRMPDPPEKTAFGMTMITPVVSSASLGNGVMHPAYFQAFVYTPATGGGMQNFHPDKAAPNSVMARSKAFAGRVWDKMMEPFHWMGEKAGHLAKRIRRKEEAVPYSPRYTYSPYHR